MKQFLFIVALCAWFAAGAQSLPMDTIEEKYDNVRMFYNGCMKIRQGDSLYLAHDSIAGRRAFARAMDLLNEQKLSGRRISLGDLAMSDTIRSCDEVEPGGMSFDYGYAFKKYNYKPWTPVSILRGFGKCQTREIRLKPHGVSEYGNKCNKGTCIVMAIAEYGARVKLTVTERQSGTVHEGTAFENGGVSFAKWVLTSPEDFIFRIENDSDREATIVLVSN